MFKKRSVVALAATLVLAVSTSAAPLLVNGGFETGDLTGWTAGLEAEEQVAGGFTTDNDTTSNQNFMMTSGPRSGSWYALADITGPSVAYLYQSFTIPLNTISISLDLSLFVLDGGESGTVNAGNLLTTNPNQHTRVDILQAGAGPLSTSPADVIRSFYAGADTTNAPAPYIDYSFDLTGDVASGTTYIFRVAQASTEGPLLTGIDAVSIDAIATDTTAIPEPSTLMLAAPAGALLLWLRRKKAAA